MESYLHSNSSASNGGLFYGWYVAAFAAVANFMAVGGGFYIFNAFMEPLCEIRGWSRTDVNIAMMIGMLAGNLSSFFYGMLLSKISCRFLMSVGPLAAGLALIFLFQTSSLWLFNVICALLFLANASYGGIVSATVVNNWFVEKRGKAIGLSMAGVSLSGAILPFVAMILLLKGGLVFSAVRIGVMVMLLGPAAWLVIRDWPESLGLRPDGAAAEAPPPKSLNHNHFSQQTWNWRQLSRNGNFWKLGAGSTLVMLGVVGVMSQLKPRFSNIGFDDMTAMLLMMATAFMGAVGKYASGWFYDRFSPRLVMTLLIIANIAGLILSLITGSFWSLLLFVLIFGFAMGGAAASPTIMTAYLFGRRNFAKVYKYIVLFLILDLPGMFIAARSYDLTGSYDAAYIIYIILDILALFIILSIEQPPRETTAKDNKPR